MAPEMEGTHITGFSEKGSDCPGTENGGGSRDERGTLEGFGRVRNEPYFPIQKFAKMRPKRSSLLKSPVISDSAR